MPGWSQLHAAKWRRDCSWCYTPIIIIPDGSLKNIGNNGNPSVYFPLGQCQGDCNNDNECQEGPMQRSSGGGGEAVPGCEGNDPRSTDYGYARPHENYLWESGNKGVPESAFPLGQCKGDCNDDDDCAKGSTMLPKGRR